MSEVRPDRSPREPRRVTIDDGYYAYLRALPYGEPQLPSLRDALRAVRRQLRLVLGEPRWLVAMLLQPLLYLALVRPLGGAWPIQLAIFGALFAGAGLVSELRTGRISAARVLGRLLRDTLVLAVLAALLALTASA